MEEILKFLKDCGTFYLATVDAEGMIAQILGC